jgi:hypothetical protein
MPEEERHAFFARCHGMGAKDVQMMYDRDVKSYEYAEKTYKEGGEFLPLSVWGDERVWRGNHQKQESSTGRPSIQDVWLGLSRPDLDNPHTRR